MDTLIVQMPEKIREQLNKRALSEGKDPQSVAAEILTRELGVIAEPTQMANPETPTPYESEEVRRERVHRKLREQGILVELSDELKKYIIPGVDREAVFDEMSRVGGKPLSQIVIEQRQERHDILVYGYKRARQKIRARDRQQSRKKPSRRKRN